MPRFFSRIIEFCSDRLFIVSFLLALQLANQYGYVFMGVYRSEYFTWGPNDRLFFIGAPIDTWTKWLYLVGSRVVGVISEAALGDMIAPWIASHLQNEEKVYLPYSKLKCRAIVQLYSIYVKFNEMFSLFLLLTQADVALIELVSQAFVLQLWILPNWLRKKRHVEADRLIEQLFID